MDGAWVYLVTGGCGFVGERIVELLSRQDYIKEVRVFDSVAREEVEKLSTATTRVTVMRGDIRDAGALLAAMRGAHVVLHTAAVVDYRGTLPFGEMRAVNVGGTENVLRACCVLSIPYLLYTSSIAAVGPNTSCEPLLRSDFDNQLTPLLRAQHQDTFCAGELARTKQEESLARVMGTGIMLTPQHPTIIENASVSLNPWETGTAEIPSDNAAPV
ncbi:hypothetical protein DUI87_12547 [Hirundo rustica rustica]|uniref:3-beta hydroxysteroid dehydrogenase/isomerase domain-containing protein n=1 Tax=Hirundo rustica rustica TaxID=333673 RepID=A0A3M0KCS0_HIRRU|nr:hypothetical protein DUI87_12547 [Hirundo rustica rustica]